MIEASHPDLGERYLYVSGDAPLLFTDNETNTARLFGHPNATPYVKDGINDAVVAGKQEAVNPAQTGTKAAPHIQLALDPGQSQVIRLRLTETDPQSLSASYPAHGNPFGRHFDTVMRTRREEADAFYAEKTPAGLSDDEKNVMRQALAGMLWSKQYYNYDVTEWLNGHGLADRASLQHASIRNKDWFYMVNADIISMPDKWEYPWYAAWDLAFHTVALAMRRSRFRQRPTGVDAE